MRRASNPVDGAAIQIAAAVIRDAKGRHLLVRKRGTAVFMQAGGKLNPGEAPLAALIRELDEELGLSVEQSAPRYVGAYDADAANEPGRRVHAHLFELVVTRPVEARNEIAEVRWIDPSQPISVPLAPLTRIHVLTRA